MALGTAPVKATLWVSHVHDTFVPGNCTNTVGPCELNKTFNPVHNRKIKS